MKSRETLIRLKRFQADEKKRRVAQIDAMIAEFSRIATDLDREIEAEEGRTGIADPSHFAYSTYARAARARRDNLHHSVDELKTQAAEARQRYEEAQADLTKAQQLEGREKASDRPPEGLRESEAARLGAARA